MKIKEIERPTQEYSALIYLYDEATKNSGDDLSDDIELAFETLDNAIDKYNKLKSNVKRFMELISILRDNHEDIEMRTLRGKLMKVGKEE